MTNDNEKIKEYLRKDLRLAKIQNTLIFIVTILLALIVVLFTYKSIYAFKEAIAKSVKTSCTVPEMITTENSDSVRQGNEVIYFKL